jgi:hypothetical protein
VYLYRSVRPNRVPLNRLCKVIVRVTSARGVKISIQHLQVVAQLTELVVLLYLPMLYRLSVVVYLA